MGFYNRLVDILKRSVYFSDLPQLPVACEELDGSTETMPVIFEEKYLAPITSKKASRLPSQNLSDSVEQRNPVVTQPESKLSPEKVVRALKNSLCLDLTRRNRPTQDSEGLTAEEIQLDGVAEEEAGSQESLNTSLSSPSSPLYLSSVGATISQRSCSEPNLIEDRERETDDNSTLSPSKSEWDVSAVVFSAKSPFERRRDSNCRRESPPELEKFQVSPVRHGSALCCIPVCNKECGGGPETREECMNDVYC